MMTASLLRQLLLADPLRMRLLAHVHALALPDCWIGAGFVRNAVWDAAAGISPSTIMGDVDVIWFDARDSTAAGDLLIEQRLRACESTTDWSVKNQGRMHRTNGDQPYDSTTDAMWHWPETATAVAVRLAPDGAIDIAAPFGLGDLFAGVVRPTPLFLHDKRAIFEQRWRSKGWLERWPHLTVSLI